MNEWDHYKDLSVPFRELSLPKGIGFFAQLDDINSEDTLQFVELFGRMSSLDIPQDRNTAFEKQELGKESKTVHGKETEGIILYENGGENGEGLSSRSQETLKYLSQKLHDTVLNQVEVKLDILKGESSVQKDSYDFDGYYVPVQDVQIATYSATKALEEVKEFVQHLDLDLCTNDFKSTLTYAQLQPSEKEDGTDQAFLVTQMEVYLHLLNFSKGGMEEQAGLQVSVPLLKVQLFFLAIPLHLAASLFLAWWSSSTSTGSGSSPYPHHSWQSDPNSYTLPISHAPDKTTSGTEQASTFAAPTMDAVQCTSAHHDAKPVSGLSPVKSSNDVWPTRLRSYDPYTSTVTESENACTVLVSEASSSDANSDLVVVTDRIPSKLWESSNEVSGPLKSSSTSSSTHASVDSESFYANGDELKARGGGDGVHYNSQESDDVSFAIDETEEPLPLENSGNPKTNQQLVEMKANRGKETHEPLAAAEHGCFTDVSTVSCCTKSKSKAVVRPDIDLPNSSLVHFALLLDYPSPDIGTVCCETNGARTAAKRSSLSSKLLLVAGSMDPSIPLVEALEVHLSIPPASCQLIEIDHISTSTHNTGSSQVLSKSLAMQPSLKQGCTSIPEHFPLCGPQLINLLTSTSDHFSYSILCDLAAHCLPVRAVPNEVNLWGQLCTPVYSPMAMEITEASSVSMPAKFTEVPHMYSCSDSTRNSPSDEATCELQASLKQKLQEYPWPGCTSSTEQLHHIPHAYRPPLINVLTSAKVGHLWTSTFTALCDLAAHSENTVNLQSQLCDPVSPNAMDCTMDCTPNAMDCTPINCTDLTSCSEVRVDRSDMPCHSLRPTPTTTRSTLMVPTATNSGSPTSYYHGCVPEVESRPQLRDIKRSIPIQEEIKPKLKKTKMSMPTPVREIKGKHKLRKAKRSMPLRQAMETRKTKRSLPSQLRLTIEAKQVLRKMKRHFKQWPTLRTMKRCHIPITKHTVDDESSNEGSSSNTGSSDSSGSSSGSESASGGDFAHDGAEGSSGGCGASGSGQGGDDDDDKKPPKKGPILSKESPRKKKKRRKKKRRKVSGPESDSEDCHSPANQEHPASDDGSFKEHSHPTNTQNRKQQVPELPFSAAVSNKVDSSNTSLSSSSGSCSIDKRRRGRDCDHTPSRSGQDDVPLQEEPPSRERRKRKKVRNKGLGSPVPKPRTRDSSPNYHNRIGHDGGKPIQAKKEHSYSPTRKQHPPTRKQHPPTRKQHPKTSPPVSIVLIPLVLSFIRPDSTAHGQDPPEGSPAGSSQRKDVGPHSTSVVQTDTAPIEGQPPSQTPPSPSHQHAPDRQQGLQPEGPSNPDSGAVHAHAGVPESAEDTITSSPSLPTPSAEATGPPEFSSGPGDVQQKWKRKPEPRKVSSSSLDFAVLPMHESCSETQSEYDYGISEPSNEVPDCSHLEEQLEVLQNPAEFSAGLEDEHESLHQHFNGHAPGYPPLLQHFNKCTSDSNCSDGDCTEPCPMPPQQCTYPTDGGHQVLPSPGPGCQQVQNSYETDGHHNYNATSLPNQSQFSDPYGHTAMCVGGEVFTSPPEAGSSDNPSQHHFHTWYQPFSNYCELHVPVTSPPPSQREV